MTQSSLQYDKLFSKSFKPSTHCCCIQKRYSPPSIMAGRLFLEQLAFSSLPSLSSRKKVSTIPTHVIDLILSEIVLNKLRNQVIEGWKWYWEGLGIFWCADCPCRPTSRVKRFWRTTMLMDDYLAFLSQNPWIWGIPMKGFEDVQLDLDEIEKAQGPCRACGKIWWND